MVLSRSSNKLVWLFAAAVSQGLLGANTFAGEDSVPPVKHLASRILTITTEQGEAQLPIEISRDWNTVQPDITRALIIIHGKGRNVESDFASGKRAASDSQVSATTIVITPQFLREVDIPAHRLGPKMLRWDRGEWSAGEEAVAPIGISSFSVIDALVQRVADRQRFPALREIVVAGHSAGGQIVQRYAVVGHASKALAAGLGIRFVVANPSSFLYFDDTRPRADGSLAPFVGAAICSSFNHWRYGPRKAPDYVGNTAFVDMENAYAASDVVYLQGTADVDPNHPDLDKSCAGEAQGPNRYARGEAYFHYMKSRHPDSNAQRFWQVPGAGHNEVQMMNSECGLAALFDYGHCTTPMR